MSWSEHHKLSERLASAAHQALRGAVPCESSSLFVEAAEAEERALLELDATSKPRTFGITAVSAVALYYKGGLQGGALDHAEALAHRVLACADLPRFAASQLRSLVQAIDTLRAQSRSMSAH